MTHAHDGTEQFVAVGDSARGWNLTPETGGTSGGATGTFEDFFAGGNTTTQRAPLKVDASVALDTHRYGSHTEGLDGLAGSDDEPYVFWIVGAGNGNGAVTPANDCLVGKVSVQGFTTSIPVNGIISAAGEIPFTEGGYENVPGRSAVLVERNSNGDVPLGNSESANDKVFAVITESDNSGNKIRAKIGSTKGTEVTVGVIPAGGARVYELANPSNMAANAAMILETVVPGSIKGYAVVARALYRSG